MHGIAIKEITTHAIEMNPVKISHDDDTELSFLM
jgi:hypothetical protein